MLNVPWYRDHMQKTKTAFETDGIEIPDDEDIKSDLKLLVVKNGVAQVPALKSGLKRNRHGDSAVALALAIYAAFRKVSAVAYESVRTLLERSPEAAEDFLVAERALD